MVRNSGGVTNLFESLEMFGLPVMQSSFGFTDVEGITVPTISFVHYFGSLRAAKMIFVWKERRKPATVLKNNPKIGETIKLYTDTKFNASRKSFALET